MGHFSFIVKPVSLTIGIARGPFLCKAWNNNQVYDKTQIDQSTSAICGIVVNLYRLSNSFLLIGLQQPVVTIEQIIRVVSKCFVASVNILRI